MHEFNVQSSVVGFSYLNENSPEMLRNQIKSMQFLMKLQMNEVKVYPVFPDIIVFGKPQLVWLSSKIRPLPSLGNASAEKGGGGLFLGEYGNDKRLNNVLNCKGKEIKKH